MYMYIYIYNYKNETKGYPTPCFMQLHKCSYNHQGINLICVKSQSFKIYTAAHKQSNSSIMGGVKNEMHGV